MSLLTEAEVWAISVKGGGVYAFARLLEDAVIEKIKAQGAVAWMDCFRNISKEKFRGFTEPLYVLPEETK
jgi:hypothetical protein